LVEISKAIERRCFHIAGKWLLLSSTAAHEQVCKCKAGLLPITLQIARLRLRASSSCQPQVRQGDALGITLSRTSIPNEMREEHRRRVLVE
jgi:hypothetical protein